MKYSKPYGDYWITKSTDNFISTVAVAEIVEG